MPAVRPAAVAGLFYPADRSGLLAQLGRCLTHAQTARAGAPRIGGPPKLLIVPHAAYAESGPIAASAYARLASADSPIRRVVLIGPAHRLGVSGLAVPTVDAFDTPLGQVPIDQVARSALDDLPQVVRDDRAHASEHSLEVQLPFLQAVLGKRFAVLPLAVGAVDPAEVAAVVERLWGGDETLFVISTDLSHHLPYAGACCTDRMTASRMLDLATDFDPFEACGARVLNGVMMAARRHGMRAELIDLRNSGDTSGDRRHVVGYAALALTEPFDGMRADRPRLA